VKDRGSLSAFHIRYPVFPAPFVEEAAFSPMYVLGSFVKNQMAEAICSFVWFFYSVPPVFMSVFVPIPCCFFITMTL
jgi:hypothetical protein